VVVGAIGEFDVYSDQRSDVEQLYDADGGARGERDAV
jgi:hypothetical protein